MNIKKIFFLITTLSALISTTTFGATSTDEGFSISHAEPVVFSRNTLSNSNDDIKYLSFSSFNQSFNLALKEKDQLMNGFSSNRKDVKLYAGNIEGNSKSWVRITAIAGEYSGAIFDGAELYIIDAGYNIEGSVSNTASMSNVKTAIYKSSDLSSNLLCGSEDHDHEHESHFSYKNLLSDTTRQQLSQSSESLDSGFEVAEATASQQVNLRIVTDPDYNSSSNLSPEDQVISQMNIIDGIFSEQVGVQFGITDIEVLNDNGPLTSTSPSGLLNQFSDFIGNDNPGLAHLFTGRNLDGNVIGIAFTRAICTRNGSGLTQAGGRGMFGALTAAHEFGHNFGSPHDNQENSACATTPGTFLMNPSLNGSTEFSQCSLEQIASTLSTRSCLVPVDNTPIEPIEPAENCNFSVDFADGTNDFEFVNDPQTPVYSLESNIGGSVNVELGGVDDTVITNIEGSWSRECLSQSSGNLTFSVQASLSQSSEYEADEFSQISLRVNGVTRVLDTLTGDGNGGVAPTTGLQQYSTNIQLNEGVNTIELLCFNNAKTFNNETTQCNFSALETSESDSELCFPIENQDSGFTMICL